MVELSKHEKSGSSNTQGIISLYHNAFGHQIWQGVTYCEGFPAAKPHNPLITWFCEIKLKLLYPLPQLLWLPNLVEWQLTLKGSHEIT